MKIRIGTRSSELALWQACHVGHLLEDHYEGCQVELVTMTTKGDRILEKPLAAIGGKGLFTEELERAMLEGSIDLAVHSLKDMPVELSEGLVIGAYTKRETPWDALVSPRYKTLEALPKGARIGTSSLRRQAQLLRLRPDLEIALLRGNVNTRLRQVQEGAYDGIILALAGLRRLGLEEMATDVFTVKQMIPAVGQGVLAIECKSGSPMEALLAPLQDEATACAVRGERSFLGHCEGNCQVPIGVYGQVEGSCLRLEGLIASLDGQEIFEGSIEGLCEEAALLGRTLAERLMNGGARKILASLGQEGVKP